jgi:hypothetical protein
MKEAPKASPKEKAVTEAREFFVVFAYVWFLLAILSLHKSIILSDAHIVQHQSLTVVKALAFAKIMFLAERWRFGEIFGEKPLIWPVLFKSAAFAALLIVMDMIEKALVDRFWPSVGARSGADFGAGDAQVVLSAGIVTFAALIPFFGLRELGKVLGEKPLHQLFFQKRVKFAPVREEVARPPRNELLESGE